MKVWKKLGEVIVKGALVGGSHVDDVPGVPKIIGVPVSKTCDSIIERKRKKRRERRERENASE
jgi:hypothetical protein